MSGGISRTSFPPWNTITWTSNCSKVNNIIFFNTILYFYLYLLLFLNYRLQVTCFRATISCVPSRSSKRQLSLSRVYWAFLGQHLVFLLISVESYLLFTLTCYVLVVGLFLYMWYYVQGAECNFGCSSPCWIVEWVWISMGTRFDW